MPEQHDEEFSRNVETIIDQMREAGVETIGELIAHRREQEQS